MGSSTLLWKLLRNELIEIMEKAGLDLHQFDYTDNGVEARIKHKWSESYFAISGSSSGYTLRFRAWNLPEDTRERSSWSYLTQTSFPIWLSNVKLDIQTPDLWADLQRDAKLLQGVSDEVTDNSHFTVEERAEIAKRLDDMAEYLRTTYDLTGEQLQQIRKNIDYLKDATNRVGKKDWLLLFMAVTMPIAIGFASSPESVTSMILPLLRFIGHIFGFSQLLIG